MHIFLRMLVCLLLLNWLWYLGLYWKKVWARQDQYKNAIYWVGGQFQNIFSFTIFYLQKKKNQYLKASFCPPMFLHVPWFLRQIHSTLQPPPTGGDAVRSALLNIFSVMYTQHSLTVSSHSRNPGPLPASKTWVRTGNTPVIDWRLESSDVRKIWNIIMDKTNSLKKPFSPYFKNIEIEDGENKSTCQNI